jgi:hypothetical protein
LEIHFAKEPVVLSADSRSSDQFMHGIRVLMAKNCIDNLLRDPIYMGEFDWKSKRYVDPSSAVNSGTKRRYCLVGDRPIGTASQSRISPSLAGSDARQHHEDAIRRIQREHD